MLVDQVIAAREHTLRLQADAARQRLIALATCCRPSAWRRLLVRVRPSAAGC